MFSKDDRKFLNKNYYSMALEKFFSKELNLSHYSQQNDLNRLKKNININFAIEKIYPFSNENLSYLFKELDVKNKKVATAGSSGDQILAALLFGAKNITLIDGNLYSKHFIDYKFAAIKNLSYEEFKYYFLDNNNYFDLKVFQKISHDLDQDSMTFWGTIYSYMTNAREIKERIANSNNQRPQTDFLYNEKVFEKLKNILEKQDYSIDFQIAEFNDFPSVLKGKFDAILLSNICQYVNSDDYTQVVHKLQNKLNLGGKIQLNYDFPSPFGKPQHDKTEVFKLAFESKKNNIYSVKVDSDRLYFLEKPDTKIKEPEK